MNKNKYIYLDYNATTPMDPRVIEVISTHFKETYGNSSSLHSIGQKAGQLLERCRKNIAEFINANRLDIIFTSSGTEADNIAITGTILENRDKGNHIITSNIEHHAVENTLKIWNQRECEVTFLDVDSNGMINLEDLKQAITDETILISIMTANNEIGTIQPIKEIGEIAKEHGVLFHTDAVQAFGKIPLDVEEMNIDLLSASAHKLYGPKGIGLLYMRNRGKREDGTKYLRPIMWGGGHEKEMRPSTVAVPLIAGFAKACELCENEMEKESRRQTDLRDEIMKTVLQDIEDSRLNGHPSQRLPNNTNFSFKGIDGEAILLDLDDNGIGVSTGSACSSKTLDPSHVLLAIGLSKLEATGSLRASIGRFTTDEEVEYFLDVLPPVIKRLRAVSPL